MLNEDIVVLRNLEPKIVEKDVYRYLRFNTEKTSLSVDVANNVSTLVEYTKSLLEISAVGCLKEIKANTGSVLSISGGYDFESEYLCRWLQGCSHVVLMGATTGREVMNEVNRLTANNLSDAVIINAIASSAADEALTYVEQYFSRLLLRNRMVLTDKRWSAGYGDLDIRYQHSFYELLKLDAVDVDILHTGMLIPEKSVTGFCGVR
ncbi:MAG: hypothetical protein PF692_02680 [Kiritimatiellae bacterium]|jgi:hypothetical protein|nr:hypothetical protein [Kiritimatiellia bacterium]